MQRLTTGQVLILSSLSLRRIPSQIPVYTYRSAQPKISYNQKQQGQCYVVTFLIVFLKEVCPAVNRSEYEESLYTMRYRDTLVPRPGRTVSRCFHDAGIPTEKKNLLHTEYFQSKIYQITRAFVQTSFSTFQRFSSRPKRFHPLSIYFLHYSDWNLLRSDLLLIEDQSKRSILERDQTQFIQSVK